MGLTVPSSESIGVSVLGSTGSIGTQTLDVIRALSDQFHVVALAAGENSALLQEQIDEFRPKFVSALHTDMLQLAPDTTLVDSSDALSVCATADNAGIVVVATSGIASLRATVDAAGIGRTIALANKETLICGADVLLPVVASSNSRLHPIDSEHSAIWQCLGELRRPDLRGITLTASGGPFRRMSVEQMHHVSPHDALNHPTWAMGKKITIDSATLVNKGLEVIEASHLFGLPMDSIDVVIHPESIIHSLVEFADGSTLAQLSHPDMRLPIQFALTAPLHRFRDHRQLSLAEVGALTFEKPDRDRFPALDVCYTAGRLGTAAGVSLCAADDFAVEAFLSEQITFLDISALLADVVNESPSGRATTLDDVAELTVESLAIARRWVRDRQSRN